MLLPLPPPLGSMSFVLGCSSSTGYGNSNVQGRGHRAAPLAAQDASTPAHSYVASRYPSSQAAFCQCTWNKHLCVLLGKGSHVDNGEKAVWGEDNRGTAQPLRDGDHEVLLGSGAGMLTLRAFDCLQKTGTNRGGECRGALALPKARARSVPGERGGGSRTPWHHCFLWTTWRRCSSLSAATMGCSFCRWWLMR